MARVKKKRGAQRESSTRHGGAQRASVAGNCARARHAGGAAAWASARRAVQAPGAARVSVKRDHKQLSFCFSLIGTIAHKQKQPTYHAEMSTLAC